MKSCNIRKVFQKLNEEEIFTFHTNDHGSLVSRDFVQQEIEAFLQPPHIFSASQALQLLLCIYKPKRFQKWIFSKRPEKLGEITSFITNYNLSETLKNVLLPVMIWRDCKEAHLLKFPWISFAQSTRDLGQIQISFHALLLTLVTQEHKLFQTELDDLDTEKSCFGG